MPTPRTLPSRAASSTLVPTPSVEATSTGSSIASDRPCAENAPPKLPTPRSDLGAVRALDGAPSSARRPGVPSSMSTPVAAYDVQRARRAPASRCRGGPACPSNETPSMPRVGGGARGGEIGAEPGDGEHPPAGRLARRRRRRGTGSRSARSLDASAQSVVESPWSAIAEPVRRRRVARRPRRRRCTPRRARTSIVRRADAAAGARPGPARRGRRRAAGARPAPRGRRSGSCTRSGAGPSAVSISPAYSTPTYGVPAAAKWSSTGWTNVRQQLVGVVRHRRRGVGAHPAGVRAGVALADALVVLGERQRPRRCVPSHSASSEHSGPVSRSSSTNGPSVAVDRIAASVGVVGSGHDDALAGGQPVELDHDRSAELVATMRSRRRRRARRSGRTPGPGCRATSASCAG